jgi:hypothetical protein
MPGLVVTVYAVDRQAGLPEKAMAMLVLVA